MSGRDLPPGRAVSPKRNSILSIELLHFRAFSRTAERSLTHSPLIPLRLYILPYWSNKPFFNFWHSGALVLRTERQSALMSKIKNGSLDQYGAEPLKQQQFGTTGAERVNCVTGALCKSHV